MEIFPSPLESRRLKRSSKWLKVVKEGSFWLFRDFLKKGFEVIMFLWKKVVKEDVRLNITERNKNCTLRETFDRKVVKGEWL